MQRRDILTGVGIVLFFFMNFALGVELSNIELILLFAIFITIPMTLFGKLYSKDRTGSSLKLSQALFPTYLFGMISLAGSFVVGKGPYGGYLSVGYFITTLVIAMLGGLNILRFGIRRIEETVLNMGMIYLPVGGIWLVQSRFGTGLFGFTEPLVVLTAIHFHYSAYLTSVIVGNCGRLIDPRRKSYSIYKVTATVYIIAILLVAYGISRSPIIELVGSFLLAGSVFTLAFLFLLKIIPDVNMKIKFVLSIALISVLTSMVLAIYYAISIYFGLNWITIEQMVDYHGLLNGVGFAFFGVLGIIMLNPSSRLNLVGIPFSQIVSRGRVGPSFLAERGYVEQTTQNPTGIVDDIRAYSRNDLNLSNLDPLISDFYENTKDYDLFITAKWARGFKLLSVIYKRISRYFGQMNFPINNQPDELTSEIYKLKDDLDGRTNVRAWVRTYPEKGQSIYVAAYSSHRQNEIEYMNIAFPFLLGNITSILHLEDLSLKQAGGVRGLKLTSWASTQKSGDQGVYYFNRILPVRTPINETIHVWTPNMIPSELDLHNFPRDPENQQIDILARHEVWLFGIKFLTLEYQIFKI